MNNFAKPQVAARFRGAKHLSAFAAFCLVASAAGCGGGSGGPSTGGNNNLPSVPALPTIAPSTPTQAVNALIEKTDLPVTGITVTTLDSDITSAEIAGVTTQFSNPANIAFPQFTSADGKQGTFASAADSGITQAELNTFFTQNYPLSTVIKSGDSLQDITFQLAGGKTLKTLAVTTPTGAIRFCPALNFVPGGPAYPNTDSTQEVRSTNGANGLTVKTNRNPFTGTVLYAIPQQVQATLDSAGGVTSTKIVPLQPTLGPGVSIESQSQPVITNTVTTSDDLVKAGKTGTVSSALHTSRTITYTVTYTIVIRIGRFIVFRFPITITTTIIVPIPHTGGG